MAMPVEQFVRRIEESGLLAGDTLREFLPPKASPANGEELARELVRRKMLTTDPFRVIEVHILNTSLSESEPEVFSNLGESHNCTWGTPLR